MDSDLLKKVVSNGMIILDARDLKHDATARFITNITLSLNKLGANIKIGLIVSSHSKDDEYEKVILSYDETEFDLSYFFYINSKINFKQDNNDTLKVIFEKNKEILFITQNQKIAFDVASLSNDKNKIYVRRVSGNGLLTPFPMIVGDRFDKSILFSYIIGRSPRVDKISYDCDLPKDFDSVFVDGVEVKLREQIGSGGEGNVYAINNELVAKIFNNERLTKTRVEKISLMVKKRISDYNICWPISEVKNKDNFVVGYTMKRCTGKPISTLYRGPVVTQQLYPNFKVYSPIDITIKILNKIKKLHENNVLLGDINDRNFIVDQLDEVFLIDTDSYQLEDYVCDVGTVGYIAPELKEGILATTLRSFEDESYGIAVFIFRTLMQGYFPFAQVGKDKDYVQLIKQQQFPYSLNSKKTKKKVPQLAFECWESFPALLMKMFINTFSNSDKLHKRYSVDEWLIALDEYLNII